MIKELKYLLKNENISDSDVLFLLLMEEYYSNQLEKTYSKGFSKSTNTWNKCTKLFSILRKIRIKLKEYEFFIKLNQYRNAA